MPTMTRLNRLISYGLLLGSTSTITLATEFAWVPVGATGSHTINGNEIILDSDDQVVTLEIRLSKFDEDLDGDPQLSAYQASLDARSYDNGAGPPLTPLEEGPCVIDSDCFPGDCGNVTPGICDEPQPQVGAFGILFVCFDSIANPPQVRCERQSDCPIARVPNPEFPFEGAFQFAVATSVANIEFLAVTQGACTDDNGTYFHGGILKLVVPPGAIGTYTIRFLDDPEKTGMRDCNALGIDPNDTDLVDAKISIRCAANTDCDDTNACTTDVCSPTGACTNVPNFNASQFCCATTTGDLTQLSDLNDCTFDNCNPDGSVSHPNLGAGTSCGNPANTQCDKPDSCDGAGLCLDNLEPNGAACGNQTDTECNGADTCNGSGTCLNNILLAGAACGSDTNTDCTNPDTCDALGNCLTNDQVNGAICDDSLFCTDGEQCADGLCTGGIQADCSDGLSCTADLCDEQAGQCATPLDAGKCLIAGTCFSDGNLNPQNDCQECDSTQLTNDWTDSAEGSLCDDGNPCTGTGRPGIAPDSCDLGAVCTGEEDPQCNDTCDFAIVVAEGTTSSNNSDRGPDDGEASCQLNSNNDVWFRYTAKCDGEVFISTTGSSFLPSNDPVLSVYDACPATGGTEIACDDDSGIDLQAALTFFTTSATEYLVRVAGFDINAGDIALNILTVEGCVIDAVCYAEGELNPQNQCLECDPSLSALAWSPTLEGRPCGSDAVSDCDNADACDGLGTCETNPKPDGTPCTEDGNECSVDICELGICTHPAEVQGTSCGDESDTECDDPDSCNAIGQCVPNFALPGIACGDSGQDQCDNPDICDGNGDCDPNFKEIFTPCDDGDICTGIDICSLGLCAGTAIPQAALVESIGPKSIAITPQPADSVSPIALFVTSPDWPCLGKYLGGIPRCSGSDKRCESIADCNGCSLTNEPCTIDADCRLSGETCVISGETCDPGVIETVDLNNDGFSDGVEAALVENPALREIRVPAMWGTLVKRCSKSFTPCINDFGCDIGLCNAPECSGGVCELLGPCSVDAQDCGLFCSDSFLGCAVDGDCPGGETCVSATCVINESCEPGKVFVGGSEIVPGTRYEVRSECGAFVSDLGVGSSCLWADVNCNGVLNVTDIQLMLLGFKQIFKVPFEAMDIWPCNPNKILNVTDIQRAILAFKGQTYEETGCPVPCS